MPGAKQQRNATWVRVVCGTRSQFFARLVGRTVGEVRELVAGVLPIPEGAVPRMHRRRVAGGYVLRAGQTVVFRTEEGEAT